MASAVATDIASGLLDLDQSTAKILRVQEQHRLAVGADLRLAVAQNPRPVRLEALARGQDVVDLVAQMVDTAVGIAFQEFLDRRGFAQRLEELDLGVGQADEHRGDAVLGLRDHLGYAGAQRVPIDFRGLRDIADRNGDVVEPSDHSRSLVEFRRAARLYRQDVNVAYRLLVPVRRKRGAHGAAKRFGNRAG